MKNLPYPYLLQLLLPLLIFGLCGCKKGPTSTSTDHENSSDTISSLPRFVTHHYIDLSQIGKVSRFRSGIGHSYTDDFESCRNMKHYFVPKDGVDWSAVSIYAPVNGTIVRVFDEWAGTQIQIAAESHPDFVFALFHISTIDTFSEGQNVTAGQLLGTHISDQTYSDIAVNHLTSGKRRLVSIFDVMTDSLFQDIVQRGIPDSKHFIISERERNASPLSCDGETFADEGVLKNWTELN